ncbi:MAG: class I SAM-dependent methyltransferase [Beijerinckiaceae bacterium]
MERVLRFFISAMINRGCLEVETASGARFTAGDGSLEKVGVRFTDQAAQVAFMLNPLMKLGELFMEGRFEVTRGTIYDLLAIASINLPRIRELFSVRLLHWFQVAARRAGRKNNKRIARRNVAHHYDLDLRLYELFLDTDMQYSCAYFEHDDDTLDTAQLAKKRHIAAKLLLDAGDRVLDIGCGWGGLALYFARMCGAKVTGVTLSEEQVAVARQRAIEAGFSGATEFRLQDYRDVNERYDRVVSVGMFEHVGVEFYDAFFQKIARLLTEDGVALLHTIGSAGTPGPTNPWITKYIFPGGYIPTLSEIMPAIERAGLFVTDIEVLSLHYAQTLRAWRERFMARRDEARSLYDERFCRMWEFYLSGSESSFRYESHAVFQIQLAKKLDAVPLTRTYIAARECDLRRQEQSASALRIVG